MVPCETFASHQPVQQVILSVIGVPGALLAGWLVELPLLGRKGTLALSTSKLPCARSSQKLTAPR